MPIAGWGVLPFETSPLSPLPSPSHLPGEGNAVGAVVLVGCCIRIDNGAETHPIGNAASTKSPSPGRWEGDGRGDRGEVSGRGEAAARGPTPPHPPTPPPPPPSSPAAFPESAGRRGRGGPWGAG